MIQPASALPAIALGPVKPGATPAAGVSGFALALVALMPKVAAPAAGLPGTPGDAAIVPPGRQPVAESGKELPDAVLGLDGKSDDQASGETEDDTDESMADDAPPPPYAWFAIVPPPIAEPEARGDTGPAPAIAAGPGGTSGPGPEAAPSPAAGVAAPDPAVAPALDAGAPVPAAGKEAVPQPPVAPPVATPAAAPQADAAPPPPAAPAVTLDPALQVVAEEAVAAATTTAPSSSRETAQPGPADQAPHELRQAAGEAPVVRVELERKLPPQRFSIADLLRGAADPAAQAAGAAQLATAVQADPASPAAPAALTGGPGPEPAALAAPATGAQTAAAVTPTGQAQDAAVDTRHQQWTAQMIDKIEALRDAAPVRETRLSLMPEALGKVDIAIRQDDAGIHVQFNTDSQAARQLIADAQPKLAEIAQERGIRLGSTSVESNATGTGAGAGNSQMHQGQRQDGAPARHQPSAPPSARREASTSTHDDERIA